MTEQQSPSSANAREALETIQTMAQSARRRARPPRWFGITMALLAGTMVALAVADLREGQVLVILVIGLVAAYQGQKTRISVSAYPLMAIILAPLLLVPLYFGLIAVTEQFVVELGRWPAALLAGTILAAVVYALSLYERAWFSRTDDKDGEP